MERSEGSTTSPTLLDRVRDARDHPAWREFFGRYDPLLHQWCRYYRLDDESADELCQRTWQRLWPRMRTFQYDPSLRFRSWLRRFFHSRAMDLLNERNATTLVPLESLPDAESCLLGSILHDASIEDDEPGDEDRSRRLLLLAEGEKVQEQVKARVDPATWQAFWMTKVEGRPFAEAAGLLGKSYAAVYYGSLRVLHMLRREGERRLGAL
jgi:RNA polymerase sigma-70 factor (ECF subfamily)